jgi:streptogramin lyase
MLVRGLILSIIIFGPFLIKSQTISTIAGTGSPGNSGDGGPATLAQLHTLSGIAIDGSGNIYVSSGNLVRKIDAGGTITKFAGGNSSLGDGGPASAAQINMAGGLDVDAAGNVYICDFYNHRIRKVNTAGIISTIAGNGSNGYSGDGGPATSAQLKGPFDVSVDAVGNVFIADGYNHVIRKINTSGIISTVAGNAAVGFSGDGGLATAAQLDTPHGIDTDANGNIYISDGTNRIRKVDLTGIITTYAGTGSSLYNGDGGPATSASIGTPNQLEIDPNGILYFPDGTNNVIRKIDPTGNISTICGTGTAGFSGDGGPSVLAQLNLPIAVTLASGNMYIADAVNYRVRMIQGALGVNNLFDQQQISIYPNPALNILLINSEGVEFEKASIEITNMLGQTVLKQSFTKTIDISKLNSGCYQLRISNSDNSSYRTKFLKE